MQRLLLIIAACLALVAAGCGGDSDTTSGATGFSSKPREEREAREQRAQEKEAAEGEKAAEKAFAELPDVSVPQGPPPKQLVIQDLKQGSGETAKAGDLVSVNYIGVFYAGGGVFDYSWGKEDDPFKLRIGDGGVIPGWEEGIPGMRVGGIRKLIIPPDLAYGESGSTGIPPNSTLVFQIKLLGVN